MTERTVAARRARPSEVGEIAALVDEYAGPGYLLPRTREDIRRTVDLWYVAPSENGLLACGSLLPYSDSLAEIRSMAVAPGYQGNRLGSAVLKALIDESEEQGFARLFALTRAVPFFQRHGFALSRRHDFPEKVWRDCLSCPFLDDCDEVAVVLDLPRERTRFTYQPTAAEKGVYHAERRS